MDERHIRAAQLLFQGIPQDAIADELGISPRTLFEWSRRGDVKRAIADMRREALARMTAQTGERMALLADDALGVIASLMADESAPPRDRLSAAKEILKIAPPITPPKEDEIRADAWREHRVLLAVDGDRQFSAMLERFFDRCEAELGAEDFAKIVDLFPSALDTQTIRDW